MFAQFLYFLKFFFARVSYKVQNLKAWGNYCGMHHVCSGFHFFPTFESGRYKANFLPTECLPVPNNDNRDCVVGGRIFTTMDGRGKRRVFLLGTQACIGRTPMKINCCSLKKKGNLMLVF